MRQSTARLSLAVADCKGYAVETQIGVWHVLVCALLAAITAKNGGRLVPGLAGAVVSASRKPMIISCATLLFSQNTLLVLH